MPPRKRKIFQDSSKKKKKTDDENMSESYLIEDSQRIVDSDCELEIEGTGTQQMTNEDEDEEKDDSNSTNSDSLLDISSSSSFNLIKFTDLYHDVGLIAHILKDWLYKKQGLPKFIPKRILNKVILDTKLGRIFKERIVKEKDEKLQQEFLQHVFETLVEEKRCNVVYKIINDNKETFQGCFIKAVEYFNDSNLDIFTKITTENMPSATTLSNLLECTVEVAECLKPEEIDIVRQYILNQQEIKLLKSCNCCVQTYINNDLQNHKKTDFKNNFKKIFSEKESLIDTPIYCYDVSSFKKAMEKESM